MRTNEKVVLGIVGVLALAMIAVLISALAFSSRRKGQPSQQIAAHAEASKAPTTAVPTPKPKAAATAILNGGDTIQSAETKLIAATCPQAMSSNQFAQCVADAKQRIADMNRELVKFGDKPIIASPVRSDRCVTIFGVGAGPMEFYPNGYGLWIEKDRRFLFFPKGSTGIQLRVDADDDDYVSISLGEKDSLVLQLFRSDEGTFDRIGDWDKVRNADELFETAMYFHSRK